MRGREELLFAGHHLSDVLQAAEEKMNQEVAAYDSDRLLNTSEDELADYFAEKYSIEVPELHEDEISADGDEVDVDVSRDFDRAIIDRSRPYHIKGFEVTYHVPFSGDKNLFGFRPSTFSLNPPRADVRDDHLRVSFRGPSLDPNRVKHEFDRVLSDIRQPLERMRADASKFNEGLRAKALGKIKARKQKILNDRGILGALGVPLRRRDDAPQTYAAPRVRKTIRPKPPAATSKPFTPEPTLLEEDYQHILEIIGNMVHVIERSPSAFETMGEEDLRQHFLVQLNGQYQGDATGETFNYRGKTDILIRQDGENIFIAECKFWHGPKALTETIDQILGYVTWRDTKTAIVLFNRNKNFSQVLAKIPEVVRMHPNFKREVAGEEETVFRYIFSNRDDPDREVILTVMAFDVPGSVEA